jgi:phosphoglycolate phosphatase-like HAD superfamily hydrolase
VTIAVDFDEVLFPLLDPFLPWAGTRLGRVIYAREVTNYDLSRIAPRPLVTQLLNEFTDSEQLFKIEPLPGAVNAVEGWKKQGHRVVVITGRPQVIEDVTRKQLLKYGFSDCEIVCTNQYQGGKSVAKGDACKRIDADVLIDDMVEHINSAIDVGCRGIFFIKEWTFDTPLNPKAQTVSSWADILKLCIL